MHVQPFYLVSVLLQCDEFLSFPWRKEETQPNTHLASEFVLSMEAYYFRTQFLIPSFPRLLCCYVHGNHSSCVVLLREFGLCKRALCRR